MGALVMFAITLWAGLLILGGMVLAGWRPRWRR